MWEGSRNKAVTTGGFCKYLLGPLGLVSGSGTYLAVKGCSTVIIGHWFIMESHNRITKLYRALKYCDA